VGSERDAGEKHVYVSVMEAGHDEAVLEIAGDEAGLFGLCFDFIVASYRGKYADRRDDKGFGPGLM
jgi:hypothetical protein